MKEHFKETVSTFFIIVTLINVAMFVIGLIFRPEQKFGYEVFIYPLIYGAISCIPNLIMYTKKEMSVTQVIIRKIIQLILIVAVLLVAILGGQPLSGELFFVGASITGSIVLVFIAVNVIEWWLASKTAGKMTEDLEAWKEKFAREGL
ncbi:MAG: hypothetical protein K6G75_10465 [Lachnospiraceae bacterium]|nr:hypothetical protein [Lachnospiraceae bacterium]